MGHDGRRLQLIDALLREESVDQLLVVLAKSENELATKRSAIVALLGDAHPEVLRCATAISKINSNCQELVDVSHRLKGLQSELQSSLLDVGISRRHFWDLSCEQTDGAIERQDVLVSRWLSIEPNIWSEVTSHAAGCTASGMDVASQHDLGGEGRAVPMQEEASRMDKSEAAGSRSFAELPRSILDMLAHLRPLQGVLLLCGWGPRLRQFLSTRLKTHGVNSQSREQQQLKSLLTWHQSYFSCHDLLGRARISVREALVSPVQSLYKQNLIEDSAINNRNVQIPFFCQCSCCQRLLQCFTYPGPLMLLEAVGAFLLLNPRRGGEVHEELLIARSQLMEKVLRVNEVEAVKGLNPECELVRVCFRQVLPHCSESELCNLVHLGFQLSNALRIFEVSNELLLLLDDQGLSYLQQTLVQIFNFFASHRDETISKCDDCWLCKTEECFPFVHLWGDCLHVPVVSDRSLEFKTQAVPAVTQFTNQWKPLVLQLIEQQLERISDSGIHSLATIDAMWRMIYVLMMGERLRCSTDTPFGGFSSSPAPCHPYTSAEALLNDPLSYKFCMAQAQTQHFWSNISCATSHPDSLSDINDILIDVARVFDRIFDVVLDREIKKCVRSHVNDCLSSLDVPPLTTLNQLDSCIGMIILISEGSQSAPYSWCRLLEHRLDKHPLSTSFKFELDPHLAIERLASSSSTAQHLLRYTSALTKSFIIESSLSHALAETVNSWSRESLEKNNISPRHWGQVGWNLSFLMEVLQTASQPSDPFFPPDGFEFVPFMSWLFKVTSSATDKSCINTVRAIATGCLYRWTLSSIEISVNRLKSALVDASIELNNGNQTDGQHSAARVNCATSEKGSASPAGLTSHSSIPKGPFPAFSSLLFEVSSRVAALRQRQETFNHHSPIVLRVAEHLRQCVKAAVSDTIFMVYNSYLQDVIPFKMTIQVLFDLELAAVLFDEHATRREIPNRDKLVPSYLTKIWRFDGETDIILLLAQIREKHLPEVVDRLLYSGKNMRIAVVQSLQNQLLLITPLVLSRKHSGPLGKLHAEWKSEKLLRYSCNSEPPVAPSTPRLPLIPITVNKNPPTLRESRLRNGSKRHVVISSSETAASGKAALDYTVSAAAAFREMKDGLLNINVAADLGSSVSSFSSFLRGHVEGFSSKVSEAMKNRNTSSSAL